MATTALASTALLVTGALQIAAAQSTAPVLPTGGTVAAGAVTINQTAPNHLAINQTSGTAITNWQSFSIGAGSSVAVVQPSTSSAMLARVTGSTTSTIAGSLTATGQLMLVNPNGISITSTGTINAGSGFVATTLGISDNDFLAGLRTFTGKGASAAVSNAGTITVGPGGYAALIGGTVDNSGVISVPLGKVGLGSGELATLDFSGDGFLQVGVPTGGTATSALVSNTGKIKANGGTVEIKAAAARNAARQAINMSGVVEARSVSGRDGNISLDGSDGAVVVTGKLTVASRHAKGGTITVTGRDVKLTGAKLDASGKLGGGTILIGGDKQGKGTLAHADTTTIDATTVIKANAVTTGNGGTVVVWSDSKTDFAGFISATGGALGGNGGMAEVSSHGLLNYAGLTVLTAPYGTIGTLLLDPYDLTIVDASGSDTNGSFDGATPTSTYTATGTSTIKASTLEAQLANANVTLSTSGAGTDAGTITVSAPLTWSSASVLTLNAVSDIAINGAITATSGGLTLNSGGTITATASVNLGSFVLQSGNWAQNSATLPSFSATDFQLNGGSFLRVTGGDGTSGTPYRVTDVYGLQGIGSSGVLLAANWTLANDIDASGTTNWNSSAGFNPIGTFTGSSTSVFSGTFDGNGHTVSGLTINRSSQNFVGLFGYANGATIKNIGLTGGTVAGSDNVGVLIGWNETSDTVSNVYSTGSVTGAGTRTGGLIGTNYGNLSNAYATGTVSGVSYVGGLVGYNDTNTISNSYATGWVIASNDSVGGLVGWNGGTVTNSYASGLVFNTGGGIYIGGLVGYNGGTISNVYATDLVRSSGTYIGGLVGWNSGSISNSYATGAVATAGTDVGGLVGHNASTGTIASSFWDTSTTGFSGGIGVDDSNSQSATGLITTQLQSTASASGLGSAFGFGSGLYPYLTAISPSGVQAISGIAYNNYGVVALGSTYSTPQFVYVDIAGKQTLVTTGANGYYYLQLANNTLSSANGGTPVLAYTLQGNLAGPIAGATLTAATGTVQHFDIWGLTFIAPTTETSLSSAQTSVATPAALLAANGGANQTLLTAAAGTDTVPADNSLGVQASLSSVGYIATSASGFDIDQGISAYGLYVQTTTGPITVSSQQIIGGPITLSLISGSSLAVNASISASSSPNAGSPTVLSFASNGALSVNAPITITRTQPTDSTIDLALTGGSLTINSVITVNGAGAIDLVYDTSSPTNLSFGLTNVGFTGSVTYTNSDGTAATTSQGGTLTVNGAAYTLLYSMSDLQGVNSTLGANYALNTSLDATSTNWTPLGTDGNGTILNSGIGFAGTFEGLGHTISNLAVNLPNANYVGLFGVSSGTIRDIGVDGSVVGDSFVGGLVGSSSGSVISSYASVAINPANGYGHIGGLVGFNSGSVMSSFATGAVTCQSACSDIGGLVGDSGGTISASYATGNVTAVNSSRIGGLAGSSSGTIGTSYAMGAVTGAGSSYAGGLVGYSGGTIGTSYSMGVVATGTGGVAVGGLVGYNGGVVTSSYWDTQTSGQTAGIGLDTTGQTVNGLTTAQLQDGTSPSGLGSAFTLSSGLYPYLTRFFPNGVEAISGIAYTDSGVTPLAATANGLGSVNIRVGAGSVETATTGANGYYYLLLPTGTLSGSNVLAYTTANTSTGAKNAVSFQTDISGSLSNLDISGDWRRDTTSRTSLSSLNNAYQAVVAGTGAAGFILDNRSISAYGNFRVNGALAVNGTLTLDVLGNVTQTGAISANTLILGNGSFALTNTGNQFSNLVVSAAASLDVYDAGSLTIASGIYDACGCLLSGVSTTGSVKVRTAGDLTIASGSSLSGGSPVLIVGGAFVNNAGSTAVSATSGRWLVYSSNPAGDTFGGLDSGNTAVWNTAAGSTVSVSGNRYVFAYQPMLTVAAVTASKTYGDFYALNYAITGVQTAVAGAYLGDMLANIVSGTATVTSSGTAATANIGNYAITVSQGSLASTSYGLSFSNGTLTVGQRAITVTADAKSRIYGGANPALTYTVGGSGLVNGDTLSGALSTTATVGDSVGNYAIDQGSLAASSNYALSYTGANLTVGVRTITVTADAKSRGFGAPNPTLTYAVGGLGLVNGDALSGQLATSATAQSSAGQYLIGEGTLAASGNYALSYQSALLTVVSTSPNLPPSANFAGLYGSDKESAGKPAPLPTPPDDGLFHGFTAVGYDTASTCTGLRACSNP